MSIKVANKKFRFSNSNYMHKKKSILEFDEYANKKEIEAEIVTLEAKAITEEDEKAKAEAEIAAIEEAETQAKAEAEAAAEARAKTEMEAIEEAYAMQAEAEARITKNN